MKLLFSWTRTGIVPFLQMPQCLSFLEEGSLVVVRVVVLVVELMVVVLELTGVVVSVEGSGIYWAWGM